MDRVVVQPIAKDRFRVYKDFSYQGVCIPKGFVTNGANIPRVFWSLFPPNSPEYLSAVVIHDYMCANVSEYGYEMADRYFYEAMIEIGVSKWKAKLFYFCVKWYHKFKVLKNRS
ncbi:MULTISPECIES: DUF1353 domain-containing protein [Campylobacter]|uniref:DUF1353 domain-containing protein n=1 Tax=Campylobacter vicugnae TaxID=1660076 RepID=A0ABZ2E759_9BACT|nr:MULTISPECIES: DUF1353 domain-containing protein [unclassified Campylobacter]ARR04553.1 DUF1353 domain protein [Campylobacter sp. RM12175]MCR8690611.1 DUF1353 domain-containing protein [Campylobacter sp. RM9264]MCR8701480.1 DUF1353 domain-containing protein [Campylobacter sp. RM12176]